ncbi:MAG TPA: hypothetical protein PKU97_22785 [Kofleriaceae bacterium]|mgnify:CR=1 FL=1|nr:hypothetical protein [Kofleriaceae bacterium]
MRRRCSSIQADHAGRAGLPSPASARSLTATVAVCTWTLASAATAAGASPLRVGVMAEVGVPDGGAASVAVTPVSFVRLHAGVAHNLVSTGLRAGLTLVPLSTWATPTLSLGAGRYPEGDANPLARRLTGDPLLASPLLDELGYDYASAHLGLELGRRRVTLLLHVGASRITTRARGLEAELTEQQGSSMPPELTFSTDPRVTIWTVSARLGLLVYLSP